MGRKILPVRKKARLLNDYIITYITIYEMVYAICCAF